jgi:hypothetical protein
LPFIHKAIAWGLCGLGLLAAAAPARADLTPVTAPTTIFNGPGTEFQTYMAFDETTKVYFVVWGRFQGGPCMGVFLNNAGAPLSTPFTISDGALQCGWTRVSAGGGRFFVSYTKRTGGSDARPLMSQMARFISYNGAGGANFVSGEIAIDGNLGLNPDGYPTESDSGNAYVPASNSFLVTWWKYIGQLPQSYVRRVSVDGTVGQVFQLTDNSDGLSDPEIACDPATSRCLAVGFSWDSAHGVQGATWSRLIDGTTGAPLAPMRLLDAGVRQESQTIAFSQSSGQFIVSWVRTYNRVIGITVDVNGNPTVGQYLIKGPTGNGCDFMYGQIGGSLTYNAGSGTSAIGLVDYCGIAYIQELTSAGAPIAGGYQVVSGLSTDDNQPTVAANAADAQFAIVHNYKYAAPRSRVFQSSTRSGGGGGGGGGGGEVTIDLSPAAAPNGSWFLAEGSANSAPNGFKSFYLMENSNPVPISVRVYFANEAGKAVMKTYDIGANTRKTLSLIAEVGAGNFGTVFQSQTVDPRCPGGHCDIEVERSMFWGPNLEGSTDATATKGAGPTWYFAEGSRGGELFNNYYLLFNPNQSAVQVTGTYYRPFQNTTPVQIVYTIGPQQRLTIDANAIPQLANTDFSATFTTSGGWIVAERSMFWGWNGPDQMWTGGHGTMGANTLYKDWYFAEGNAAANFETFFLLLNPNPWPIRVTADLMTEFSGHIVRDYEIQSNTRATIYLNGEFGKIGPTAAHFYTADGNWFLAERSIYWGNRVEGSNTVGALGPANEWHLPEGSTAAAFFTYAMVANPNPFPVPIDVSVYVEGIGKFTMSNRPVVPAFARLTLDMRAIMSQLEAESGYPIHATSFSTRIAVPSGSDPGVGIVVEHAMYWNYIDNKTYWRSGGASMGIPR